jgi:hypothetical protein
MSHAIIYTPLQLGEIRLLTIHPGTSDSSIQCNLDVTSLTTAPEYEALSYVWGLPGNNKFIAVGNRPFEVGWNLEVALRYLRLERKYRRLWIDAICIDQTNSAERSTQVASMHRIYSGASSVLIWLGELDERRERAFDFIEQAIRPEFSLDAFIVCYAHEFGVGQDGRTVDNVKQTLKGFSPSSHPSRILDLARNMPGMPLYTPMDKMDISMALGHIFSACGQPYSWWSRLWYEILYPTLSCSCSALTVYNLNFTR